MTDRIYMNLAFEDLVSEHVLRKILSHSGRRFEVLTCFSQGGYGYLKRMVPGFNNAAKSTPFLLLTDLDSAECAPSLIDEWLEHRPRQDNLLFRVAVREVESWIMADRAGFASFLGISVSMVPLSPDDLPDAKSVLIRLAERCRSKEVRTDIVPRRGGTSRQGPNYNGRLATFVDGPWSPVRAAADSPSLRRTLLAIEGLSATLP